MNDDMSTDELLEWQREVIGSYRLRVAELISIIEVMAKQTPHEAQAKTYCNSVRNFMAIESGAKA